MPYLAPRAITMSWHGLLPRAMTWCSVTLMQMLRSVLMSLITVTTKGPEDAQSLCHYLWPSWCSRDVTHGDHANTGFQCQLPRPWRFISQTAAGGHVWVCWPYCSWVLSRHLWLLLIPRNVKRPCCSWKIKLLPRPYRPGWLMLPPRTLVSSVLHSHVWISSPGSSARVYVNVHGSCINLRLRGYLGYILPYVEMLAFGGHVTTLVTMICLICNTIKGHDVIWASAVTKNHVCVHGLPLLNM